MDKIERLIDRVIQCPTWEMKKNLSKKYLQSLNDSLKKSEQFVSFLNVLAKKDILIASYVSGVEGRHIVAPYLKDIDEPFDVTFIECCLFLHFNNDLAEYLAIRLDKIDLNDIRYIISEIRDKTNDILLLRFLRVLNKIDCQLDYIDDVFLDCPIDTPDFEQEERKFCQELFERRKYLVLYDYISTRENINFLQSLLRRDKDEYISILKNNIDVGSLLLLLSDTIVKSTSYFEKLIDSLNHTIQDLNLKKICIFLCCLKSCIILSEIPIVVRNCLKNLNCDSEYLLRYRKYIGHNEILCFKKFLSMDIYNNMSSSSYLLDFLHLIRYNNTFGSLFDKKESMKPLATKNKKYLKDNKHFAEQLNKSQYSDAEKDYIRRNTHLRMYTGLLLD